MNKLDKYGNKYSCCAWYLVRVSFLVVSAVNANTIIIWLVIIGDVVTMVTGVTVVTVVTGVALVIGIMIQFCIFHRRLLKHEGCMNDYFHWLTELNADCTVTTVRYCLVILLIKIIISQLIQR